MNGEIPMINFKEFLTEAKSGKAISHLLHAHRAAINFLPPEKDRDGNVLPDEQQPENVRTSGGHAGIGKHLTMLNYLNNFLQGKKVPNSFTATTKMDGAPSFLVRKNGGVASVAYKSAGDNDSKWASTHEDVDRLFAHSPGLADKMHRLLEHAGKVLPDSPNIYQGDMMGDESTMTKSKGQHSIRHNLVSTDFGAETPEGKRLKNSKIAIALHTMITPNGKAQPIDAKTRSTFIDHPDVYNMNPTISVNPANYTPDDMAEYHGHLANATKAYSKIPPEAEDFWKRHSADIESYLNRVNREGSVASPEGYMAHISERSQKRLDGLKSEKGRTAETQRIAGVLQDAINNRQHLKNTFEMMSHLQNAQNVLRRVAAKNQPYSNSINGVATEPEGIVMSLRHGDGSVSMSKITNPEFTNLNLQGMGQISQAKAQQAQLKEEPAVGHGFMLGGFDPFTKGGHELLSDAMAGGNHESTSIYTTRTPRSQMTPEQKVDFIRQATGGGHYVASASNGFNALTDLYNRLSNNGQKEVKGPVVFYHGPEESRANLVQQFQTYNGVSTDRNGKPLKHGYYNFPDGIVGRQVGTPEGRSAVSGTKARASKTPEELANYLPDRLKPRSQEVFNAINGLKEETDTIPAADAPSVAELSARGSMESGPKKKKIKEETGTGSVGGLGFNTGNPAANDDHVANYVDTNTADADTRDNVLKGMINRSNGGKVSVRIGFKAFDPTQKGKK